MSGEKTGNGNGGDPFEKFLDQRRVRLIDLDTPLGQEVQLPTGRWVTIQLFDTPEYQLWASFQEDNDGEKLSRLLRAAIPSITEAEIGTLSPVMGLYIVRAGARQGDAMLGLLRKNAERPGPSPPGPDAASPPQPSTPATKSTTSPRGSRKRSAAKTSGK